MKKHAEKPLPDGIALDLVLLPDQKTMQMAIAANRELAMGNGKIILSLDDCLPHITLAMGVVQKPSVPFLTKEFHHYFSHLHPLHLKIMQIASETIPTGETVSEYQIQKSHCIMHMHYNAFSLLKKYALFQVGIGMLYQEPNPEPITLSWIENWLFDYHKKPQDPTKASESAFFPHITLGVGEYKKQLERPIPFTADRIALCQLGNYCTCRKILAEEKLKT